MGKEACYQNSFLPDEAEVFTAPTPQRRYRSQPEGARLREAISPYIDLPKLRRLASAGQELEEALRTGNAPDEVVWLLATLATVMRPAPREQIRSPFDIASLLTVEMSHLTQEEMRVVCLNTRNYVQTIETVYRGTVNASLVRPAEVLRPAIIHNSPALIVAHNHPSGSPEQSPEDVLMTRQIYEAGR